MWRLWRLMHPGKAGDALVAPHFSEVEETASGGRYGGGCAPGGRAGSGGGWVVEGVVSHGVPGVPDVPSVPVGRVGQEGKGGQMKT